jgi:hypothetical protein
LPGLRAGFLFAAAHRQKVRAARVKPAGKRPKSSSGTGGFKFYSDFTAFREPAIDATS